MGKLMFLLALVSLTQNEVKTNHLNSQVEDVKEFVYWEAFSNTFTETADFWKAESAALEAESIADNQIGIQEWMKNCDEESEEGFTEIQTIKG